jgi:hypothetical protein
VFLQSALRQHGVQRAPTARTACKASTLAPHSPFLWTGELPVRILGKCMVTTGRRKDPREIHSRMASGAV